MVLDDNVLDRIVEEIYRRLTQPEILLEASGRHCHLSSEAVAQLFGAGYQLTKVADLSQPGQFSCKERVRVIGPKGELTAVVVLGPERSETQVELSMTDALSIGVKAPVRLSGQLQDSPGVRIVGPKGELALSQGAIVAMRHIHVSEADAKWMKLEDGQRVSVLVPGTRPLTFHDVPLRVSANYATAMHIDYDEANACGFKKGMRARILPQRTSKTL